MPSYCRPRGYGLISKRYKSEVCVLQNLYVMVRSPDDASTDASWWKTFRLWPYLHDSVCTPAFCKPRTYCDLASSFLCTQCHVGDITCSIKTQDKWIKLSIYHFFTKTKAILSYKFSSQTHKHSTQVLTPQDYFSSATCTCYTQLY